MSLSPNHFYQFNSFRLEPGKRQLTRDGRVVSLPPKAFDTLLLLVKNSGQAVKKDDLIKQVWPDSFVDENNLNQYISLLRKKLGGEGQGESFIKTVPRWGYRFVADVQERRDEETELMLRRKTSPEIVIKEAQVVAETTESSKPDAGSRSQHRPATILPRAWSRRLLISGSVVIITGLAAALFLSSVRTKKISAEPAKPLVKSIAVLPFRPLARNASDDDEYLGLGLADSLITDLGQLHGIKVRPTSAIRKFSDGQMDPLAAGRGLGVDAILDGSFQRSDGRIRITLQLISLSDNAPVWTERFDEQFTNIFGIEDDISAKVMRALNVALTPEDARKLTHRPNTRNADAYKAYLIGRSLWSRRDAQSNPKSIEYFSQAIKLDPNYAEAYAGLADSYLLDVSASAPLAKAAALKAIALDDTLSEPHTALAGVELWYEWDWPEAEREFKRALQLNPNDPTTHHWYANYFYARGRVDEARRELEQALDLDPTSIIMNADLGQCLMFAREYDKAIAQLHTTEEMDPGFVMTHLYLAQTYELMGKLDESINEFQEAVRVSMGNHPYQYLPARSVYEQLGWRNYWQNAFERDEKLTGGEKYPMSLYDLALVCIRIGDSEKAFAYLEKAYQRRENSLVLLQVDPLFDSLRQDPRYSELLRGMKVAS